MVNYSLKSEMVSFPSPLFSLEERLFLQQSKKKKNQIFLKLVDEIIADEEEDIMKRGEGFFED